MASRSDTSEPTGGVDCCWSLRSACNTKFVVTREARCLTRLCDSGRMADEVTFRTALASALTTMGLGQLKPKQVRE